MDLFELGRLLHSGVGTGGLGGVLGGGVGREGRPASTAAPGGSTCASLLGVMGLSSLMVAGKALGGRPEASPSFSLS